MIKSLWLNYMIKVWEIIKQKLSQGERKYKCFRQDHNGVLWFESHLVVPKNHDLDEAHLSKFSIHPGSTKMYQDLRQNFWWTRMKREIAKYVSECDTCQRVKASHLKVAGLLQPLHIPSWKWEDISMDSLLDCQTHPRSTTPFGLSWIDLQRWPISSKCTPPIIMGSY